MTHEYFPHNDQWNNVVDPGAQKEQFSMAFVGAIAAAAGYSVNTPKVDDDSVDITIAGKGCRGTFTSPRLEVQLKCTSGFSPKGGSLRYPLKVKNYDDLRKRLVLVPRILVVAVVPKDTESWIKLYRKGLIMKLQGYWVSLLSLPGKPNKRTVTVYLPTKQQFSPEELERMMHKISSGGKP